MLDAPIVVMIIMRKLRFVLLLYILTETTLALKCRTEDGPTDAELKRVARTCMRKVSEGAYPYKYSYSSTYNSNAGSGLGHSLANTNYYGQQNYGHNTNGKSNGYSYGHSDDDDGEKDYRGNIYERDHNDDMLRQRNRERMQNNRSGRSRRAPGNIERSSSSSSGGSSSTSSSAGGRYDQSNSSNNGRNSNGGNSNNGGNNQRSSNANGGGSNGYISNSNNNNNSSSHNRDYQTDGICIVHCFFEEMNMLNSDDYPDKHKVSYLLTKDLRDRELRAFYTETIQDCYHYLESQRRREKCQFSRELINCMTEYAKANCDDWEDYNIMFN